MLISCVVDVILSGKNIKHRDIYQCHLQIYLFGRQSLPNLRRQMSMHTVDCLWKTQPNPIMIQVRKTDLRVHGPFMFCRCSGTSRNILSSSPLHFLRGIQHIKTPGLKLTSLAIENTLNISWLYEHSMMLVNQIKQNI